MPKGLSSYDGKASNTGRWDDRVRLAMLASHGDTKVIRTGKYGFSGEIGRVIAQVNHPADSLLTSNQAPFEHELLGNVAGKCAGIDAYRRAFKHTVGPIAAVAGFTLTSADDTTRRARP